MAKDRGALAAVCNGVNDWIREGPIGSVYRTFSFLGASFFLHPGPAKMVALHPVSLPGYQIHQLLQDPGGGAPDDVLPVLIKADLKGLTVPLADFFPEFGFIQESGQGQFDDLFNLLVADLKGVRVGNEADKRGDTEIGGNGAHIIQLTQDADILFLDSHLLLGFPQGSGKGSFPRILTTAGKGDLALVAPYALRPPGKDDVIFSILFKKGDQHRRPGQPRLVNAGLIPAGQDRFDLFFHG